MLCIGVPPSSSNTTSTLTFQHNEYYTSGTNNFRTGELLSLKVTPGEGDDSKSITPEKDVEMDGGNVVGIIPPAATATAAVPAIEGGSLEEEGGVREEGNVGGEASRPNPLDIFMAAVELRDTNKAVDETAAAPADDEIMGESNSNEGEMAANNMGENVNGNGVAKSNGDSSTGEEDKVAVGTEIIVESMNDDSNNGGNKGDESAAPLLVGEEGKEGEPTPSLATPVAPVVVIDPILVGTLAYSDRDHLRRHIIRGSWKYENAASAPPERFELIRHIPPEEDLKELPKDGEFNGSFNVQMQVKTSKGKIKLKSRAVSESGVKLTFKPKDESRGIYDVNGTGLNEFGVFELYGSATKNRLVVDEDPTYSVSVHKRYAVVTPRAVAPTAAVTTTIDVGEAESKDVKRKHGDAIREEDAKPQPTAIPAVGVCLRGTLVRNTSEELSLDNTAVHRITGLWSMMGLTAILDEPSKCEKFEYEHKTSGESVFPLSGKYTGFFYVSDGPEGRTKVAERDVTLKFIPNSEGQHNVEGRGSNVFGKYSITGTLLEDGTITLSRHFQSIKLKTSKKPSSTGAVANGGNSNSALPSTDVEVAASVAQTSLLTFDDVDIPKGDEIPGVPSPLNPPEQFAATSRGILKIEPDGTHTCSGSWALSNEHFQNGLTSKYHFGVTTDKAEADACAMIERFKACNLQKEDDRQIQNVKNENGPVTLAHSTFPLDSTNYKGSFKLRKGPTRTQTIIDNQIILKFVKNSGGSYNVYGKGVNEMGTFDIKGTLILQGKSNGLMQLCRIYPPVAEGATPIIQSTGSKKSSKVFRGGLTEKATPENSGPAPAMTPAERFVPSASGLLRRESSRQLKPPARLDEDDPEAIMNRCMDKCRTILQEMNNADVQKIFAAPVNPKALGIPTYFAVIKDPMDLGSIKTMMDNDEIDSPEEFARLVRLTFENAITFNTLPDNIVHVQARNLLALFTKRFGTIDKTFNSARKNKTLSKAERQEQRRKEKDARKDAQKKEKKEKERKRRAEIEASNESKRMKLENVLAANKAAMAAIADAVPNNPNADVTRTEFNLLLVALRNVQGQIVGLHKLIKKASSNPASSANAADNLVPAPSYDDEPAHDNAGDASYQPPKAKKKKVKKESESSISPPPSPKQSQALVVENLQPLTFEEQEALSDAINLLPERLLPDAMNIIRESDFVNDDDDEIDLDIDQLDTRTQRKLQRFVMEYTKPKKKKKAPKKTMGSAVPVASAFSPVYAMPEVQDKQPSSNQRLPGGKSFFALGDDDDSDDDKEEEDEVDIRATFATNWVANPTNGSTMEEMAASDDDAMMDDGDDDLWGAARKEAEASKAREADRSKREEKMRAEAELASQKRMAEMQELGEQARVKRLEEEAEEARLREEQELEVKEASKAAREQAIKDVEGQQQTVDLDATRDLMAKYEQEFNDNYSAGASPSSDFGF